jgi:hypothetical protein
MDCQSSINEGKFLSSVFIRNRLYDLLLHSLCNGGSLVDSPFTINQMTDNRPRMTDLSIHQWM